MLITNGEIDKENVQWEKKEILCRVHVLNIHISIIERNKLFFYSI